MKECDNGTEREFYHIALLLMLVSNEVINYVHYWLTS